MGCSVLLLLPHQCCKAGTAAHVLQGCVAASRGSHSQSHLILVLLCEHSSLKAYVVSLSGHCCGPHHGAADVGIAWLGKLAMRTCQPESCCHPHSNELQPNKVQHRVQKLSTAEPSRDRAEGMPGSMSGFIACCCSVEALSTPSRGAACLILPLSTSACQSVLDLWL